MGVIGFSSDPRISLAVAVRGASHGEHTSDVAFEHTIVTVSVHDPNDIKEVEHAVREKLATMLANRFLDPIFAEGTILYAVLPKWKYVPEANKVQERAAQLRVDLEIERRRDKGEYPRCPGCGEIVRTMSAEVVDGALRTVFTCMDAKFYQANDGWKVIEPVTAAL